MDKWVGKEAGRKTVVSDIIGSAYRLSRACKTDRLYTLDSRSELMISYKSRNLPLRY